MKLTKPYVSANILSMFMIFLAFGLVTTFLFTQPLYIVLAMVYSTLYLTFKLFIDVKYGEEVDNSILEVLTYLPLVIGGVFTIIMGYYFHLPYMVVMILFIFISFIPLFTYILTIEILGITEEITEKEVVR